MSIQSNDLMFQRTSHRENLSENLNHKHETKNGVNISPESLNLKETQNMKPSKYKVD